MDRYREELQVRHDARGTISTYAQWVKRFLRFHGVRHPLATVGRVSASTQNQALSALLFLYRQVLGVMLATWKEWCGRGSPNGCRWCSRWRR